MPICQKCSNQFGNRTKINGKIKNLGGRKYCLDCSPYGLHNTKQLIKKKLIDNGKTCSRCSVFKEPKEFYSRRNKTELSSYCKICTNQEAYERFNKMKIQCVAYKGGKCENCGYHRFIGALDFHHTDPTKKDFGICQRIFCSFEKLKPELDKCKLLCSNCHREEHAILKGNFNLSS